MADDQPFYSPAYKPPPPRPRQPGELLFEFVRGFDRAAMSCKLRFHGESFGWEAQIFDRGELYFSHGAFTTRAAAVQWAQHERRAMESAAWGEPLPPVRVE